MPFCDGFAVFFDTIFLICKIVLSKFAEKTVSYDCDGNGFKEYNSKDFNPAEPWEKVIKEKLDCIYSERHT